MVAVVDELERVGLVERQRSQEDRRHYHLSVTKAGERMIREAEQAVKKLEEALFSPLNPAQQQELHYLLSALFVPAKAP